MTLVTVRPGVEAYGRVLTAQRIEDVAQAKAQIRVALGGSAAERLVGLDPGIGSSSDTATATRIAALLVDVNGVGTRARGFNPQGLGGCGPYRMRAVSEELLGRLDEDVLELLDEARADVEQTLGCIGTSSILRLARLLLERETMLGHEFADAAKGVALCTS